MSVPSYELNQNGGRILPTGLTTPLASRNFSPLKGEKKSILFSFSPHFPSHTLILFGIAKGIMAPQKLLRNTSRKPASSSSVSNTQQLARLSGSARKAGYVPACEPCRKRKKKVWIFIVIYYCFLNLYGRGRVRIEKRMCTQKCLFF